jgi:hypothetical protein
MRFRIPHRRAAGAALGAAVAAAVTWAAWSSTWSSLDRFVRDVDISSHLFADYTMRFDPVAREVLETHHLYPGYYYSPTFALILAPVAALPLERSLAVWGAFQVLVTAALGLIPGLWLARRSSVLAWAYAAVFLTSMPVLHNFNWGQVSGLMTLAVLGTMLLGRSGRPRAAALVLAGAAAIKFYPALFALPFALRRDVRFLAWFAGGWLAFGLLLPALAFGPRDTVALYREAAANMETDRGKITADVNSQYLPHVIERWTYRLRGEARPLGKEGSPLRSGLRAAAAAVFLAHLALLARRAPRDPDPVPAFAVLTLSIPFLIPTAWPHYFVFLPFFQAWAAWRLRSRGTPAGIALGALLLASVAAASVAGYRAAGDWWTYSHAGVPALASVALLVVVHAVSRPGDRAAAAD